MKHASGKVGFHDQFGRRLKMDVKPVLLFQDAKKDRAISCRDMRVQFDGCHPECHRRRTDAQDILLHIVQTDAGHIPAEYAQRGAGPGMVFRSEEIKILPKRAFRTVGHFRVPHAHAAHRIIDVTPSGTMPPERNRSI